MFRIVFILIIVAVLITFALPAFKEYSKAQEIKNRAKNLEQHIKSASDKTEKLAQTRLTTPNIKQGKKSEEFKLIPAAKAGSSYESSQLNPFIEQAQQTTQLSKEILSEIQSINDETLALQEQLNNPNRYLDENSYIDVVTQIQESESSIKATYDIAAFYSEYSKAGALFATGVARIEVELREKQDIKDDIVVAKNQLQEADQILQALKNNQESSDDLKKLSTQTQQSYKNLSNALTRLTNLSKSNPDTQVEYLEQQVVGQFALDYEDWKKIEEQVLTDPDTIKQFNEKAKQLSEKINQANQNQPSNLQVVIRVFTKDQAVIVTPKTSSEPSSEPTPTPAPTPTPIAVDELGVTVAILRTKFTIKPGQSQPALTITSKGATAISMIGYPTSYGPGINWSISSAGLTTGRSTTVNVQVNNNISPGTYKGSAVIQSYPSNKRYTIPNIEVTVESIKPSPAPTNPSTNPTTSPAQPEGSGATLSTEQVNLNLNRGETKDKVFSFTSTGSSQFSFYGYPTSYGPGINLSPSSGGIGNGQKVDISISVNSNVPAGTYTGTQIIKFNPGEIQKTVSFTVTVVEPAASSMGFTFSANSVNVTVQKGQSISAFTFTSTGSTSFSFIGYPTTYGPGINWWVSSGGIGLGQSIEQKISVNSNTPAGTYTGTALFRDGTKGAEKSFPVTVKVTD